MKNRPGPYFQHGDMVTLANGRFPNDIAMVLAMTGGNYTVQLDRPLLGFHYWCAGKLKHVENKENEHGCLARNLSQQVPAGAGRDH